MKTKPMDQKKDPRDSISFLSQTNPHKRAGKEKEPQKIFLKNSKTTRSMKNGGGRPPEPRPLPSFPAPKMVNVDTSKVTRLALGPAATRNREKKTFGRNSLRFPFLPPPVCPPCPHLLLLLLLLLFTPRFRFCFDCRFSSFEEFIFRFFPRSTSQQGTRMSKMMKYNNRANDREVFGRISASAKEKENKMALFFGFFRLCVSFSGFATRRFAIGRAQFRVDQSFPFVRSFWLVFFQSFVFKEKILFFRYRSPRLLLVSISSNEIFRFGRAPISFDSNRSKIIEKVTPFPYFE